MAALADLSARPRVGDLPPAFADEPTGHVHVQGHEAAAPAAVVADVSPAPAAASSPRSPMLPVRAVATLVMTVLLVVMGTAWWSTRSGGGGVAPAATPTTLPTVQIAPVTAPKVGSPPTAARVVPTGRATASVTIGPEAALGLATASACWVRVRGADGRVAFERTLRAGEVQQVAVTPGATLRLGSPAGATVTIDGAVIELPGSGGVPIDITFVAA